RVVAGRDRQERASVVVESDRVVETGRFGGLLAKAHHAFGTVVKPPGWTEFEYWVMPRQGRKLTTVRALVEREENDAEPLLVAESIQQRLERVNVVDGYRDIRTGVTSERLKQPRVVIPERAGMNLHHEAVVETHPRHLQKHLPPEQLRIRRIGPAARHARKEPFAFARRKIGRAGRGVAVVRCRGAGFPELGAPNAMRLEVAVPCMHILSRDLAAARKRGVKIRMLG